MAFVMRFFHWVWKKITSWVFFWKRVKSTHSKRLDPSKPAVKGAEKCEVIETLKLVELPAEALVSKVTEPPKVTESSKARPALAKTPSERVEASLGSRPRLSLLQLPRTAVQSVSTFMVSTLQKCFWKIRRPASPLGSREAEMLREVYLVLWAIRKQLRQLARRQEQRRQRHLWALANAPPAQRAPAQAPKQDARSPL